MIKDEELIAPCADNEGGNDNGGNAEGGENTGGNNGNTGNTGNNGNNNEGGRPLPVPPPAGSGTTGNGK